MCCYIITHNPPDTFYEKKNPHSGNKMLFVHVCIVKVNVYLFFTHKKTLFISIGCLNAFVLIPGNV